MSPLREGFAVGCETCDDLGHRSCVPQRAATWSAYLIECICLALFMVSAAIWATALQHPASPFATWVSPGFSQRVLMGIAMGATAVVLIYSPMGARSGAHMNPALTLAYWRLGKMEARDVVGYIVGQFAGGTIGILAALVVLRGLPADASVNYVATVPGAWGWTAAFGAESAIAFLMMMLVLTCTSRPALTRFTGVCAGIFVALCIAVEAPLSGMSMNPARTLGTNVLAGATGSLWIYFIAPTLGMQLAALVFSTFIARRVRTPRSITSVGCPRLYHPSHVPCRFGCGAVSHFEEHR